MFGRGKSLWDKFRSHILPAQGVREWLLFFDRLKAFVLSNGFRIVFLLCVKRRFFVP